LHELAGGIQRGPRGGRQQDDEAAECERVAAPNASRRRASAAAESSVSTGTGAKRKCTGGSNGRVPAAAGRKRGQRAGQAEGADEESGGTPEGGGAGAQEAAGTGAETGEEARRARAWRRWGSLMAMLAACSGLKFGPSAHVRLPFAARRLYFDAPTNIVIADPVPFHCAQRRCGAAQTRQARRRPITVVVCVRVPSPLAASNPIEALPYFC
jgi:hypothetical protein